MNSYKNGVIMGTISCIAPTTMHKESRIKMHRKQLDFIEHINQIMADTYGLDPIPYFRVEQGWEPETQQQLTTTVPMTSITYDSPIPPGSARNALLTELYDSDADWLVVMDDDHGVYDHYAGYELLWELSNPTFIEQFCKKLIIIAAYPAYWEPFKEDVAKFGKADTHWWFTTTKHPGCLPFACIPNIYKYTGKKLFFDATTQASKEGEVPEDLKFMIDWLKAGGQWYQCRMLIGKSMGDMNDSSIFVDLDNRKQRNNEWVPRWAGQYLKTLYPRNPDLWVYRKFIHRKNPKGTIVVPRQLRKENCNE